MELNIQTAELALREASESNPGAWADHSRFVAEACKNIAASELMTENRFPFFLPFSSQKKYRKRKSRDSK